MAIEFITFNEIEKYNTPEELAFAIFRKNSNLSIAVIVHSKTRNKNYAAYGYDFKDNNFFNEGIEIVKQATARNREVSCFNLVRNQNECSRLRNTTTKYLKSISDANSIKELL